MAYMNQERKSKLAPAIKAHCAKYGIKATLGVSNHMTLVVNIKSGKLDLCGNFASVNASTLAGRAVGRSGGIQGPVNHIQVNEFHCQNHFTGKCRDFIVKLVELCNIGNHDNSDAQTDYFDVGWYLNINIGRWDTPYEVSK